MKLKLSFLTLILFSLMIMIGCGQSDITNDTAGADTEGTSNENKEGTQIDIPKLTIEVGEETIETISGIYSWTTTNEDGTSTTISVDPVPATEIAKDFDAPVVTSETKIVLKFEAEPDDYDIQSWDENNETNTSKEIDLSGEGRVIYEIIAEWEQGTTRYVFELNID